MPEEEVIIYILTFLDIVTILHKGRGAITTNRVSLISSSFLSDPPTFTLLGATSGGPTT